MGAIHKLTVTQVQSFKKAGLYSDGGCLCFQITVAGVKSWVFRYMHIGKPRMMGLGPLGTVSLSKARELAADYRAIKNSGRDPIEYRDSLAQLKNAKEKKIKTFEECAVTYIDIHKLGWKNKKHIQQWSNTLSTYAFPIIGHLDVNLVGDAEIRAILDPIWHNKTETATRIRSRLERIIDWSRVQGYREGENPARWRGHQEFNFPIATKLKHIKHHPALPFETTPQFYKELLYNNHLGAKAL
ncbi:MAG: DUF4102 domain-containing protein, partial [Kordiimonadaceae bacterium]|nr:DUF4102 domain-containing protein [Kordiimonadaceae bacterium]